MRAITGRRTLLLLWVCFLARGVFYCVALPLWEGFDEYAHFAYVERVAVSGQWLVQPETPSNREVERSIELVAMPWTQRAEPPPHETYESYWRLPEQERRHRQRELADLPRQLASQDSATRLPTEAQQPPLNYWLMAAVYMPLAGLSLPARVLALRLFNVLLASAVAPAAWLAGRRVFGSGTATALAALVALMPEMFFDAARVANSGLSTALFSALVVLALEAIDGRRGAALAMGPVLGLGLLTKAYFLAAVPAVVLALGWAVWKRRVRLRSAMAALGTAAAISGWYYLRNLRMTGAFSGLMQDAAIRMPLPERLGHLPDVSWWRAFDSTFVSHIWFGGWSFLAVRAWIYHLLLAVVLLAACGLVIAWVRRVPARRHVLVAASFYLFFCLGLVYHTLITFLANGVSTSDGWYLYALIVPEVILATAGLRALAPAAARAWIVPASAFTFASLDIYGMHFVALPYYTGLIGHKANGFLEAFHMTRLAETGMGETLRRIAVYKPAFLTPALVAGADAVYVAATIVLIVIAFLAGRRERPAEVR